MSVSGIGNGGFNPAEMMNRFQAADIDKSGSLSKSEVTESLSAKGIDEAKIDKIFNRMDANGDGQITAQEQQDMMQAMQDRMEQMMGHMGIGNESGFDSFKSIIESMESESTDSEQKQKLSELLEKIKSGDFSQRGATDAVNQLNTIFPPININV